MQRISEIVEEELGHLDAGLSDEQKAKVAKAMEKAVIRGMLEGQHRAVDTCSDFSEAEQDTAHKIRTEIRRRNDALIANLSALR